MYNKLIIMRNYTCSYNNRMFIKITNILLYVFQINFLFINTFHISEWRFFFFLFFETVSTAETIRCQLALSHTDMLLKVSLTAYICMLQFTVLSA